MQWFQIDVQRHNNGTVFGSTASSAQCDVGTETYPDAGKICENADDNSSHGNRETAFSFRSLVRNNILQT